LYSKKHYFCGRTNVLFLLFVKIKIKIVHVPLVSYKLRFIKGKTANGAYELYQIRIITRVGKIPIQG